MEWIDSGFFLVILDYETYYFSSCINNFIYFNCIWNLFLLKLQKDFGFIKKLSLKAEKIETDIEIFSNDNSKVSYFDRYLDDVLYLFKQSGANA